MSKSWIALLFAAACLAGCGDSTQKPAASTPASPSGNQAALSVTGPKGTVAIGDDLAKAKAAFPAPKGAQVFDTSMNFAILGGDGWAWADPAGMGFEVALTKGKISGFAITEIGKAPGPDAIKQAVAKFGEPTRKAMGKTADALVWEVGENARFTLLLRSGTAILGTGTMTLIGRKEDLKMLSYRADDPQTTVKIMDAGAEQMGKLKP